MSEVKLIIEDRYLRTFLDFLKTLNYVSVREVAVQERQPNGAESKENHLRGLAPGDPLRDAIRPLRQGVTAEELINEQGYQATDWKRLEKLAADMDIREPVEDLLAQLNA